MMQIKESVQIKEGFSKIQKNLHDMIRILNLNEETTSILSVVRAFILLYLIPGFTQTKTFTSYL
jgi:hypothetical protein